MKFIIVRVGKNLLPPPHLKWWGFRANVKGVENGWNGRNNQNN